MFTSLFSVKKFTTKRSCNFVDESKEASHPNYLVCRVLFSPSGPPLFEPPFRQKMSHNAKKIRFAKGLLFL